MDRWPTKTEVVIMQLLATKQQMFGLEMIRESEGQLKRGSIYVLLQRLEDKGFVASEPEERVLPEIGIPRRRYSLTGLGQRVLEGYEIAQHAMLRSFA